MRETDLLREFMLLGSEAGARLFRNNVGVAYRKDGVPVKFGLCKGSSDLIGWVPVTIRPGHVGARLAVFVALEVKHPTRGAATAEQLNFLNQVAAAGGIAILSRYPSDSAGILNQATVGETVSGRLHVQMSRP